MRLVEPSRRFEQTAALDHATGVFGTSHAACALPCFDIAATLGDEGVPIGPVLSSGGLFCYDPWIIYNKRARFNVGDPNVVVMGELGSGKALDLATPIATPQGWTTMGGLEIDDEVFGADGHPVQIIETSEVMTGRDCYAVEFSDGSTIVADGEHGWATKTYRERWKQQPHCVRTTREIAATLKVAGGRQNNHAVRVAAPLTLPRHDLPIPPRLLGLWLGDGNSDGRGFTTADVELANEFNACVEVRWLGSKHPYQYRLRDHRPAERAVLECVWCGADIEPLRYRRVHCGGSCAKYSYWAGRLLEQRRCVECACDLPTETWHSVCMSCRRRASWHERLARLGVLGNKHIPQVYLRASYDQRLELLSGLLDTDGWVSAGGQVAIDTTSEALAIDIRELVHSLGWRVSFCVGRAKLNGRDCGAKWRLTWTADRQVFRLNRKRECHNERRRSPQGERDRYRYITGVWRIPSRPVRCIRVAHPSGMFLAGRAMIPTHNSTTCQVYLRRQWCFGRFIRVIDPRGEYRTLARDLDGQIIRLARDGGVTLNPLESPDTRHALLRSVAAATMRRDLAEREPALLNVALDAAGDQPVLPMVLDRLFHPTGDMANRVGTTERMFAREARDLAMAMQPLCEGDLAGLFDDHTSADVDFDNQFILLDLSPVFDDQTLGILMACATGFLQAQIDRHYRQGDLVGQPPKSILAIDEAWRILALPGVGEWLRERIKFSRKLAQQNICVMHGLGDLDAAGDEGTRVTRLVQSLVRDCSTFVLHKMPEKNADLTQQLLGLSDVERELLTSGLDRGCALWRIGPHRFVVATDARSSDLEVTSPDRAMAV